MSDGLGSAGSASDVVDATVPVSVVVKNRRRRSALVVIPIHSRPVATAARSRLQWVLRRPPIPRGRAIAYSLRTSDPAERMYMVGGTTDALYALDGTTSEAVRVGTATQFGVSERFPRGMTWHNGQLYMIGGSGSLYTLDALTGEAALVASKEQIIGSGGPTLPGRGLTPW